MDSLINTTLVDPMSTLDVMANMTLEQATNRTFTQWMLSRLRIFLYISNPYEEMFESVDQVADYHTEVSLVPSLSFPVSQQWNPLSSNPSTTTNVCFFFLFWSPQSFPFYFFFIMLEWFVLWCQGKPIPLLGDSATSASMILNFECFRWVTHNPRASAEHSNPPITCDNPPFHWYTTDRSRLVPPSHVRVRQLSTRLINLSTIICQGFSLSFNSVEFPQLSLSFVEYFKLVLMRNGTIWYAKQWHKALLEDWNRPITKRYDTLCHASSSSNKKNLDISRLICRGLEHSLYFYLYHNYRIIDLPWDSPYTWYFAAIAVDFCYYWGHRASHGISHSITATGE